MTHSKEPGTIEPFSAVLFDEAGHPVADARVRIQMFAHSSTSPRDSSGRRTTSTSYNYVRREVIDGSPLENLFETTTDPNGAFTLSASRSNTWLKLDAIDGARCRDARSGGQRGPGHRRDKHGRIRFRRLRLREKQLTSSRFLVRVAGRVTTKLPGVRVEGLGVLYQDSHPSGSGITACAIAGCARRFENRPRRAFCNRRLG